MRLLLVTTESFLTGGAGIATYTEYAVRAHLAAGHSVHMLALSSDDSPPREFSHPNFRLTHVGPGEVAEARASLACRNPQAAVQLLATERVRRIIAQERFDLIEGQDYLAPLGDLAARRRFGHMPECPPIVIFGHGMAGIMARVSAELPNDADRRTGVGEVTCAEWADRVLSPSEGYSRLLARELRRMDHVRLVREPYECARVLPGRGGGGTFCMLGRISFVKGADRLANFANVLRGDWPIERLLFIGAPRKSPFDAGTMGDRALRRLHPDLRPKARFTGTIPREEVFRLLADTDFHVNLSRFESFSYAQAETLMSGVAPIVMRGTPMAELLPPSASGGLLDPDDIERRNVLHAVEFWSGDAGRARLAEAQQYASSLTSPNAFIEAYRAAVSDLVEGPPRTSVQAGNWTGADVTVCLPTHNDAELLEGALDAIAAQDAQPARVLVFDDGTWKSESLRALERISARPGVSVESSPNIGVTNARNELIRRVETEYVLFHDADDRLASGAISSMLRTLNSDGTLDAAIPQRQNFGESRERVVDFPLGLPAHWVFNDFRMTSLLRASVFRKLPFPAGMRFGEADDWWFWLRFALHGHRAAPCPEPVFLYSFAKGSISWPWSAGQAAMSAFWIEGIIEEAAQLGRDLSGPMREVLLARVQAEHEMDRCTVGLEDGMELRAGLLESRWLALGTLLGQAAPLRRSLADPTRAGGDIPKHMSNSGWMRLGRRLGIRIEPRRKP